MPRRSAIRRASPLLVLLAGCPGPEPDTAAPALQCPEGTVADGDACVPEHCGVGTWGDLEPGDGSLRVDPSAAEGGDGSADAPFSTIGAALDAAAEQGNDHVVLAAGTYTETLSLGTDHAGLHLEGRCADLVVLDASGGGDETGGIELDLAASSAEVSGLTVQGSNYAGVLALSGEVTLRQAVIRENAYSGVGAIQGGLHGTDLVLEDCELVENMGAGLMAFESGVTVTVRDSVIRDSQAGGSGVVGVGLAIQQGAALVLASSEVSGNRHQGLLADGGGTTVTVEDSTIRDTHAADSGLYGFGIQVSGGASVEITGSELSANAHAAVSAGEEGTEVVIRDSLLYDTRLTGTGLYGVGVQVGEQGTLTVENTEIHTNRTAGILASDEGTSATVRDSVVRDTTPDEAGDSGMGIQAQEGARLEVEGCEVADNATSGIYATGEGTVAEVGDTEVKGTRPDDNARYGLGMGASSGASLSASDFTLEGNWCSGLLASGEGTTVTLSGGTVVDTLTGEVYTVGIGLSAGKGASVTATDVAVDSTEGPGLYVSGEGSTLSCTACTVVDSTFAGAVTVAGGELLLDGSTVTGTEESSNLGGGVGLYADPWDESPPILDVTDSSVEENPIAGAWLAGAGRYVITGTTLRGGEGELRGSLDRCGDAVYAREGVTAWDDSTGLWLTDNTLSDGHGAGLFLDDASATIEGNDWSQNAVDLVVQGTDCDHLPQGADTPDLETVEACPTYDYSTCDDTFSLYLELEEVEDPQAPAPPSRLHPLLLRGAAEVGAFPH